MQGSCVAKSLQMVAWVSDAVPISHHYRFLRGRCGTTWQEETSCDWLVGGSHKSCQKKSMFCVSFYTGIHTIYVCNRMYSFCTNILYRGQIQSRLGDKVDSGIGLAMVNVLESTLEGTKCAAIVNSDIGSYTPCFSLDNDSVYVVCGFHLQAWRSRWYLFSRSSCREGGEIFPLK